MKRRAWSRSRAGFTLIELTVALLAGLIVAMGIVGLSRSATATFHEEIRTAAAEASVRSAIDRLRSDLQRAGYMSTANIQADPNYPILKPVLNGQNNLTGIKSSMAGLLRLSALRVVPGGSVTQNVLVQNGQQYPPNPNLTPDYIEISGNMTTSDQFEVASLQQSAVGNCQRIFLVPTSPAMLRLSVVNGDAGTQNAQNDELRAIFQPAPAATKAQFIVRLVDDTGHAQFMATCPGSTPAGVSGGQPYVDIDAANTPLITPSAGNVSSASGYCSGRCWVNPVQTVRWEITGPDTGVKDPEPAQFVNSLDNQPLAPTTQDPNKYDLMRTFVDATGTLVPSTSEIVAEYAVDLDFALTIDTGLDATRPSLVTFGFDDTNDKNTWASDVSASFTANQGPQRIRAVRVRLATRTAQPDRTANVPVTENATNEQFAYRYCVAGSPPGSPCPVPPDTTLRWARVRTITADVRLPNLARSYY
jgi:type II secretory pathway pseudopilin PulG